VCFIVVNGKTALVTGSTSGIGLAIAEGLAAAGYGIVLTGFGDPGEIAHHVDDIIDRYRVPALYLPADVSKPVEIRALIAGASKHLGDLHVLINNAGIQHVALIDEFPEERWDQIIAINLSAAFHATKAVLPSMRRRQWGRIINISSVHGLVASAGKSAYVASKHGLIGLTKVTALENAQAGITANAICPGWVRTSLLERQLQARASRSGRSLSEEEVLLLSEKQPLAVYTTPRQIADLAVYLCSESASTLTGAALSIDGGWVAQ
jgi:3-hydroxybutyrate dehydrogenase